MTKVEKLYHYIVVSVLLFILLLPLLATLIYAFSSHWGATLLPDGLTFSWFAELLSDERFYYALLRSLFICICALLLSVVLILPVIFVIAYYFPKLSKIMEILVLIPFSVPPIVSSVGLIQVYSDYPLMLTGTPWILIFCYFSISLPLIYRSMSNNLQAINLHDLMDAAHLLGAKTLYAALKVLLPNLRSGLVIALLLSFSFLIGEFVLANLLVGSRYETLQVYLYNLRNGSGHLSSALVISYFVMIAVISLIAISLNKKEK